MRTQDVDDETLMAYADNMLDPAARARIEKLVQTNPALTARVRMFQQTSNLTHAALAPLIDVPVPKPLLAAVKGRMAGKSRNFARNSSLRNIPQIWSPHWRAGLSFAVAASVAGLIGATIGYLHAVRATDHTHIAITATLPAPIVVALNSGSSGGEILVGDDKLKLVSTFLASDRSLCRELEYSSQVDGSIVAVACKQGNSWRIQFAVASAPKEDGYAPASSFDAVEAYLSAIGAGPPLAIADENAVLSSD
jgi:hypothetical protein